MCCRVSSNVYDDYEMAKGCSHWGELTHREVSLHTHINMHMFTHTYTYYTQISSQTYMYMYVHTPIHSHMQAHAHTHTHQIGIMVGARVWNYLLYLCLLVLFFMYSVFNIVHLLLLGQGLTRSVHTIYTLLHQSYYSSQL